MKRKMDKTLWVVIFVFGHFHSVVLQQDQSTDEANKVDSCTSNEECPDIYVCVDALCVNPCQGVCGINTYCSIVNNTPLCFCKPGFSGNPILGCELGSVTACTNNSNCPYDKACKEGSCSDLCLDPGICGNNTNCSMFNHSPVCFCRPGFTWSSTAGCYPEGAQACKYNSHCPPDRACQNDLCLDPCKELCGANTVCKVVNHVPACSCSLGHFGDPFHSCYPQCLVVQKNETSSTTKLKKKRFTFYLDTYTYSSAREKCNEHFDKLAVIENDEDLDELTRALRQYGSYGNYWTAPTTVQDRQFIWTSKKNNQGFVNQMSVRKGAKEESCLLFRALKGLTWSNEDCEEFNYIICQYFQK